MHNNRYRHFVSSSIFVTMVAVCNQIPTRACVLHQQNSPVLKDQQAKDVKPLSVSIIGPRKTVSIASFDVKLSGSSPSGNGFQFGFSKLMASNDSYGGSIAVTNPVEFGAGLAEVMITALTESRGFTVINIPIQPTANIQGQGIGNTPGVPSTISNPGTTNGATIPQGNGNPNGTAIPPNVNITPTDPNAGNSQLVNLDPSLQAQFWIRAVVTNISTRQRTGGLKIGPISGGQDRWENTVTMDVRLIDPLTSIVLDSVRATGKKGSKNSLFDANVFKGGSFLIPAKHLLNLTYQDFQDSPLFGATQLAIEDAVKKLMEKAAKRQWEALVIQVINEEKGLEFYLNVDKDCGLKTGDKLDLLRQGTEIIDEQTKRILGRTRAKLVGPIEVFSVEGDHLICRTIGDLKLSITAPKPGLIVRLPK